MIPYLNPWNWMNREAVACVEALLNEAEEKGLSVVELKATEAARSLYRAAGFSDEPAKYRPMKWTGR